MNMVIESPTERVLTRLEGVKRAGPGWMALCPAHDDRTPSLSITEGDDGRVLVKCFTGCEVPKIVAAIGLEQRDLFAERRQVVPPRSRPAPTVDMTWKPKPHEVSRSVVATYAYVTRHGEIAYQVQRHRVEYEDSTAGKTFTQRRPSGTGWVSNLNGVERILYRLPELAAAPEEAWVHLPEGEKDADRLASLGLVATTIAQGANATLTSAMLDDLRGRNVVIWADNDEPGRKAAQRRAEALHGVAASVVVVLPPGLSEHGDVSDWLDAGNTLDELNRLVGATPEWHPSDTAKPDDGHSGPMLVTRSAANIEPREVEWLWPGWLPAGMLTLFAGYGGGGKSTVALGIAAAVSTGGTLPDGQRAPLGNVLYLAGEDTAEYTLIPRLAAHRADRSRIQIVDGIKQAGSDDPGWVQVREHVGHIEAEVCRIGARLLVIDPISSFIGDANGDRESDVRSVLAPLGKMAERTGCAVLMIRHVSKGGGDGHRAASRILGSTAWHDLPRVAWMLGDAPDDQQPDARDDGTRDVRRVLGVVKSNLAAKPAPRWFVQPVDGAMRWLPDSAPVSIDDCFRTAAEPTKAVKVDEAVAWLRQYLAGGSKPSVQMYADAERAGHSRATMRRAAKALGAESFKVRGDGRWFWRLPLAMPEEHAQVAHVEQATDGEQVDGSWHVAHDSSHARDEQVEQVEQPEPSTIDVDDDWEGMDL